MPTSLLAYKYKQIYIDFALLPLVFTYGKIILDLKKCWLLITRRVEESP